MDEQHKTRRAFLRAGGAVVAAVPFLASSRWAAAAKNDPLRTAFKYQDTPDGDKMCSNCMHFVPGKTADAPGGCNLMAGDTEISPKAYCVAWVKKA